MSTPEIERENFVNEIGNLFADDFNARAKELIAEIVDKIIKKTREDMIDDIVFIEPIDDGDDDLPTINSINAINVYKQFLLRQLRNKV
jgi:hypothetical protein